VFLDMVAINSVTGNPSLKRIESCSQ